MYAFVIFDCLLVNLQIVVQLHNLLAPFTLFLSLGAEIASSIINCKEEEPKSVKCMKKIFSDYCEDFISRCKFKLTERELEVPMSWEIEEDDASSRKNEFRAFLRVAQVQSLKGVLDAEKLAMVSKPSPKAVARSLPGIEENWSRSIESNTTIGIENCALERLEVELFDHLTTSDQYPVDESDKAFDVSSSHNKDGSSKLGLSSCSYCLHPVSTELFMHGTGG
ncbi:hypothetical protein H6P81_010358 [Aristolochia fimbriata]|uniref:Uncharacterized protein n=1 Tax=Aristolochia fimbriata TaxID=158543 RepID=A0AAV7ET02_ARIFI|nr:hypothetical protein H6P81_010358 [Aristolochia fimbriata]